jgi:hypothetical protein
MERKKTLDKSKNNGKHYSIPTRSEIFQIFSISILITHVWGFITLFYAIPSYILRLNAQELTQVIEYLLLFWLIESIFVTIFVIVIVLFLKKRSKENSIIAQGVFIIITIYTSIICFHLLFPIRDFIRPIWNNTIKLINFIIPIQTNWLKSDVFLYLVLLTLLIIVCVVMLLTSGRLIQKFERLRLGLTSLTERVAVLSTIFLFIDLLSISLILLRVLF